VLVVGAGNRVCRTILPALSCLDDVYEIVGVYSRTLESAEKCTRQWGGYPSSNLNDFENEKIDLIIVAITTRFVTKVVSSINFSSLSDTVLLLDTPVISNFSDIPKLKHFKKFKKVLVTEDCIALPFVQIVKKLVNDDKIGKVKKIVFHHSGFKYHAIAICRALSGGAVIRSSHFSHLGNDFGTVSIKMSNGIVIEVQEPRDYTVARTLVIGEKGSFSDYSINTENHFCLEYLIEENKLVGFSLNGNKLEQDNLDKVFFSKLNYGKLGDSELINILKIRALMSLLESVYKDEQYKYEVIDGLYDAISSKVVFRSRFFIDPFSFLRSNFISVFLCPFLGKNPK